jgi:hypothetical protein
MSEHFKSEHFKVDDQVRLASPPPYFKTADPMPMLRPPDLVPVGAIGTITEERPNQLWVVRFNQGAFLVDNQYLEPLPGTT